MVTQNLHLFVSFFDSRFGKLSFFQKYSILFYATFYKLDHIFIHIYTIIHTEWKGEGDICVIIILYSVNFDPFSPQITNWFSHYHLLNNFPHPWLFWISFLLYSYISLDILLDFLFLFVDVFQNKYQNHVI